MQTQERTIWPKTRWSTVVRAIRRSLTGHGLQACYTLSRSRDSPSSVTVLWAVGLRRVHSSVLFIIMIIPFTHLSPNSVSPYVSCFRFLLCFMFPFLFAFSVLSYFRSPSPNPDPDICPIHITLLCSLWYLYVPILMYAPQSEINIDCPSNSPSEPPNPRLSLA